jgi:hypothetical protein
MTDRDDAALVYRFLRDHGASEVAVIVVGCFPVLDSGPMSSRLAVRKRSTARVLRAVTWMRGKGVEITLLSRPGLPSAFVLGNVAQGVEALGQGGRGRLIAE